MSTVGPTLVVPAGDIRAGDYLIGFHHFPSENPRPLVVGDVRWNGHSREERKIRLPLHDIVLHKDTLVLVHRKPLDGAR